MPRNWLRYASVLVALLIVTNGLLAEDAGPSLKDRVTVMSDIEAKLSPALRERWKHIRKEHAEQLTAAATEAEFYTVLNRMLTAMGLSHHSIQPPSPLETEDMGTARTTGTVGLTARLVDDRILVTQIAAESPAAQAGLKPGFEIVSIGRRSLSALLDRLATHPGREVQKRNWIAEAIDGLLTAPVGGSLTVVAIDGEGERQRFVMKAVEETGMEMKFGHLPPMRAQVEAREVAEGIGYIHISIFLPPIVQPYLAAVDRFRESKGLIIDLRGNLGGLGMLTSPVAGKLVEKQLNFGVSKLPEGELRHPVFPQPRPYLGPVVILVDEMTGSTSEILAAGLQELGRATIVGRQSIGAVLPSVLIELPGGGKLQYAFADFATEGGAVLEGVGVTPDIAVELTRDGLLEQGDMILRTAIEVLQKTPQPTNGK